MAACGGSGDGPDRSRGSDQTRLYAWRTQTQEGVKALLRDPESATFSDWRLADVRGAPVFCARVNARNGFGGMTGPQRFVGAGAAYTVIEDQVGAQAMDELWAQACAGSVPFP